MALPRRDERILLTFILGLVFLITACLIWISWSLDSRLDFPLVLALMQSIVLTVAIALLWTSHATEKLAQYFYIAIGFYLLVFGLCVGYIQNVKP